MGFLDRLLGRAPSLDELLPEPRPQHYAFAHVALRHVCERDPLVMLAALADADARKKVLGPLFDDITASLQSDGKPTPLQRPTFSAHCSTVAGLLCAVVEMPPPRAMAECYMVALVVPEAQVHRVAAAPDDAPSALTDGESMRARYFTLELGVDVDARAVRTVLCEWRGEDHVNYGDGPPARPQAFIEAIDDVMSHRRR